jgi:hypothetical protein
MKCAMAFSRTKSAHNNQLKMVLEDGGGAAVALKNGCGAAALGGGVWQWLKIAAVALGGNGGRRTCDDGISASVVKAKGLLLGCQRQHQRGWQERMLPMQGTFIGSDGKEIGLSRWRRGWRQCGYVDSVNKARVRGKWHQTSTG